MAGPSDNGGINSPPQHFDIAIVGAGAAGLATAIFIRELNPELSVALIDGARRPGAKILVSGGGRCNVTNRVVTERDFHGGSRAVIRRILRGFSVGETIAFFQRIGVTLNEEAGGKLFPHSNRARDVLESLLAAAHAAGVQLLAGRRVAEVDGGVDGFRLATDSGPVHARRVVLATGGQSLPKSGSDGHGYDIARYLGHTIVPPVPALAPLVLEETARASHKQLSGVSHLAELTVWIDGRVSARVTGSLLWTHFGISGPAALDASRHWTRATRAGQPVRVTLNSCPPARFDEIDRRLLSLMAERPRASLTTILSAILPAAFAEAVLAATGIPDTPGSHLSRDDRRRLSAALVEWPLAVTGTRGYNYAEATAGGVDLTEIDPATLESRRCRGLHLVGEILDVDGRIGGFNFQWAWSSARVAAKALAARRV